MSRCDAYRYTVAYVLVFCCMAWVNGYDQWLGLPPVGIHQWRQADGAAIAWHYSQNPSFSEIRVCNLFSSGDGHAAGEFPLLYWLSGLTTRYFNYPVFPLRWIGLLLQFAGVWAFGWTVLQVSQRPLIAVLISGLLLTSPIFAYYGPCFLPDAPAFCLILMTLACLYRARQRRSLRWLWAAVFCASLAVSLKISMAIAPLAIAIAWGAGRWKGRERPDATWSRAQVAAALAGWTVLVLSCYGWLSDYNARHHAIYFLATTRPVWNYDASFILETFGMIGRRGLPAYASVGLYLACAGSLRLIFKNRKTISFFEKNLIGWSALGGVAYFLLWFRMFREHDYYALSLMVLPAIWLIAGVRLARSLYREKTLVYALGLCLVAGAVHSHLILSKRLHQAFYPETDLNLPPDAFLEEGALEKLGIPGAARFLCPQDPSPNIALYALRRNGWTAWNFGDRITADTLQKYRTKFDLTHLALRDTALYSPLYEQFFPLKISQIKGWHLY
ncbi:MAG: glycosyltransferase family 39 protein, partial [Saprospiraceae bacterium]|nr:glycosyltransferase family 39 protein [Saprospiraceae bacterium]